MDAQLNVFTVDLEEWFHLLEAESAASEEQWNSYEVRIYDNTRRLLDLLEETDTRATFFVIGWIAKKYPDIVRKISEKYQVGSHTMRHELVWAQTPENFNHTVSESIKLLEDVTGKKVELFRAPGFSLTEQEGWAIDVLVENGIKIDCSVFPAKASHGGMECYGKALPGFVKHGNYKLKEFPVGVHTMFNKSFVFCGGGYFRLFPYCLIKSWLKRNEYNLSYMHPRDLDVGQPMLEGLGLVRKFKSYVGLKRAKDKLRSMLAEFKFMDVATAEKAVDWDKTIITELI